MFELTMRPIARREVPRGRRGAVPPPRCARPRIESLEPRLVLSSSPTPYLQTNLVSDIPGLAQIQDSSLVNPWGVSFSSTSPFWVSNQATNTSTLYSATPTGVSKVPLTVSIPTTASGPQGPTGQVSNNTSAFLLPNGQPCALHLRRPEWHHLRLERRHGGHAGSDDPRCQLHGPGHRLQHRG